MRRHRTRSISARTIRPSVERVEPRVLLAMFTVTNTSDSGAMSGSLPFEINLSNATPGTNVIDFSIASSGVQTIDVAAALPAITVPVTINGTTEGGYAGTPLIELDGAGAPSDVDGLDISAGNTTVEGLAINRFAGEGINLSVAGGDTIENDFLGTDPTGTMPEGNKDGLLIQANSDNNVITDNVISGNAFNGIYLNGSSGGNGNTSTSGNLITGNLIGTDVTGTVTIGNNEDGIYVQNAPMTTVGGTTSAARNIISGNGTGMELYDNSDDSVFEGNYIGTDITGEVALGNNLTGGFFQDNVVLRGISNSTIGGTVAGSGNVISGGSHYGIDSFVIGSENIVIEGNLVGTDATGTQPLGNASGGLVIAGPTGVTIGGTVAGAGNIISDNGGDGIQANSPDVVIQGNYIGTDISGEVPLGNTGTGISASNTGVTIGGTAAGAGNVISASDNVGLQVTASTVLIQGNKIGTDALGTIAFPNGGQGSRFGGVTVENDSNVTIGGTSAGAGNVISGNYGEGLLVYGVTNCIIQGNKIGTDITGTLPLGNSENGVELNGNSGGITTVSLGGLAPGEGNIIANNGGQNPTDQSANDNGVLVDRVSGPTPSILSNSIYNNTYLGIQVTMNNINNDVTAAPVLSTAYTTGTTSTISGSLTDPAGIYTLQFFSTPTLNASGNVEGETLLGTASVTITGASANFNISLNATFPAGSYISATATSPAGGTSEFSLGVPATQEPPTISVVASSSSVPVGQAVNYTFTITNPFPTGPAEGVVFSDPIPAGTSFFSGTTSTGATVTLANGVATADIGTIAAGASLTVTIVLVPTVAAEPSFTNTGEITATTPPVSAGTIVASTVTDVTPTADLGVIITGPTSAVDIGDSVVYIVTAFNGGPSPATGIILTDFLPGAVTYVSATSSSGETPTEANGMVIDSIPMLPAGASEILTIIVIPTIAAPPSITDSATVSANEFDPNSNNNSASLTTDINPIADLAITGETIVPGSVGVENTVTITVDVANDGPADATGVLVADILPLGLTFVSGTSDGGVTEANGTVVASVGNLAAGGTSVITIVALTTMVGSITDTTTITGNVSDPNPANNSGAATVVVTPVVDLAVALSGSAGPDYTGQPLTYTAVVTNLGPSDATNVLLASALPAGAEFVGVEADGVGGSVVDGAIEQPIGDLAAGASVTVVYIIIPTIPGTLTDTAVVAGTETDPNPANNTSSVTTSLVVPMSLISFSAPQYAVDNNAGYAAITLVRSGFFLDDVTVQFSTGIGNAIPGQDYEPVSETVDFPPGATQEVVYVPVLDFPYENHNSGVDLVLSSPTGSGVLVPNPTIAPLLIVDVNPDLIGPTVTALKLNGYVNSITSIEIDTTGALDPTTASNPLNYTITAYGGVKGGIPFATDIPVATALYDAATGAVFITPVRPLPANELFLIDVNGSRPGAVTDLAGNPLNSVAGVKPGSDYLLSVARGTDIVYPNENGDPVTLKLSGPGTIDIDRYVAGDLQILQVVGGVANKTVLTGTVHPTLQRSKIGTILGIGQFGSIRVKMTTPPFYVTNTVYPNLDEQVDAPAIDTLLPSPPPPPKTTKAKAKAEAVNSEEVKAETTGHKAKAKPARKTAAHAAVVHAASVPKPAKHRR